MFSAAPALAAVTATTGPVTAVSADGATFTGTVSTGGAALPVTWEFSFCEVANSFICNFTARGTIPAGTTTTTPVTDSTTDLNPSTAYTVKLVAVSPNSSGFAYLNSTVFGSPVTFKTTGPGRASLGATKLKVKGGHVAVVVKCGRQLACTGGMLVINTKYKRTAVACGHATFSVAAGKKKTIRTTRISAKCAALLVLAKKNTIRARLTAGFDFQRTISANVSLKLVK